MTPRPLSSQEPSTPDMKMRNWFIVVDNAVHGVCAGRTWFDARAHARTDTKYAEVPFVLVRVG